MNKDRVVFTDVCTLHRYVPSHVISTATDIAFASRQVSSRFLMLLLSRTCSSSKRRGNLNIVFILQSGKMKKYVSHTLIKVQVRSRKKRIVYLLLYHSRVILKNLI